MTNAVTAAGIETTSQSDYVAQFTAAMQAIYGADINLDQDTPDGQMMMIYIQSVIDVLDLITQVYNSFDLTSCFGQVLDARVALMGIQRLGGTYTTTNITVVVQRALTLVGLDTADSSNPVYTIADNAGNNWVLVTTQSPSVAGTYSYEFRAATPGANLTTPNTINVPVTIILGVVSVNNPSTYSVLGVNEETDASLKVRAQQSVSLGSQGYQNALVAALENLSGVTSATVLENDTGDVDADGIPDHSIWVIVDGGDNAEIANAIYQKRNAGAGMKGTTAVVITQVDGTPFVINFSRVAQESLYIKFTATSLNGVTPPNIALILSSLPGLLVPGVDEKVNINDLATLVQQIDPNCLVTESGFSTSAAGVYTSTLTPTIRSNKFVVSDARIIIIPIILSPATLTIASSGSTQQFTPLGGYGPYAYAMISGSGSVNPTTGLYTSGTPGTDVVGVTDSLGNTATSSVTVT